VLQLVKQFCKTHGFSSSACFFSTNQDVNKSNNISYTEFLAAVMEMQGIIEEYRLAEAFDQIDCDDSGYSKYRNLGQWINDRFSFPTHHGSSSPFVESFQGRFATVTR
jgi:Ca2+-binding EF-hand superfamily protein